MATFRGALRSAAQVALVAAETIAGENVFAEYDWPAEQTVPAISVNARKWRYEDRSNGMGVPQFWSVIWLTLECRAAQPDQNGTGRGILVDQMDTLSDQVEAAMAQFIIGPPQLFRRIVAIDAELDINSNGTQHQGSMRHAVGFEYANDGEAEITALLERVRIFWIERLKFGGRFGQPFLKTLAAIDTADFDKL